MYVSKLARRCVCIRLFIKAYIVIARLTEILTDTDAPTELSILYVCLCSVPYLQLCASAIRSTVGRKEMTV